MAIDKTRRGTRRRRQRDHAASTNRSLNALAEALVRLERDLSDLGRRHALVGGLAVSARAEPRLTRDIDIAVAPRSDGDAESLVRDLQARGYRVLMAVEQTRVRRLATVRFETPATRGVVVDVLFASSGIEAEIVRAATAHELIAGLTVPVACIGHLLALKVLARDDRRRPQDFDDLKALLAEANARELRRAETALALIEKRGFGRGRDLQRLWLRLLPRARSRTTR